MRFVIRATPIDEIDSKSHNINSLYMHVFAHESNLFKEFVSNLVLREGEEISDARLLC